MKKYTMVIAALLLLALPMRAERVNPETARKVATTFLTNNGVKAAQLTDLSKEAGFANLYIFTAEQGFVVMSADDCVRPIWGYSLTDKFVAEGMPENISSWLQGYSDEIQWGIDNQAKASKETAKQWKDLVAGKPNAAKATPVVDALVKTQWNQGDPYNRQCPLKGSTRTVTGCVATAMAQIMKYWNYPTHGIGSHSYTWEEQTLYADFGATTYNWADMNDLSTNEGEAAVATLMHHCGVSVNMDYGLSSTGGSGASTFDVIAALQNYFNYSPNIEYRIRSNFDDTEWIAMLKAELSADSPRPIQYRGSKVGAEGGHSFICDGYDDNNYFHFNWGWSGSNDGFYPLGNLNTTNGNFTNDQAAIFGIKPVYCSVSEPTGLSFSKNGRQITLNWTAAENATSYNIYRNGSLIGNSSSTSYTESNAPFGSNIYYVRSLDSEGNLSLSSNSVSVTIEYSTDNLAATGLQITYDNGCANLQWLSPACLQYLDFMTFEGGVYNPGSLSRWGIRFPASMLATYIGMSITSVATYFYSEGQYTTMLYQCVGSSPSGNAIATITDNYARGWHTLTLTPFAIDTEKDLWIVFQVENITYPTIVGQQATNDGDYYFSDGSWRHFSGYSFFVSANLTDSCFTYNLYRNNTKIAESLSTNRYTDASPSNNAANLYTVRIQNQSGESEGSNWVGITKGTASINGNLVFENNNMMILAENSILTVTGTLTNNNSNNLIIENGGQLITSSEDVQATVKKNIEAAPEWGEGEYTAGGWYFIASPIVSTPEYEISGMTTSDETVGENIVHTFDLYRYNESAELEWENYREHHTEQNPFTIDNGAGYLYASKNGTTIRFKGVIKPYSTTSNQVTLTQDGWNLIGNPFTCAVTVDHAFAELNNQSSVTYKEANSTINPCSGIAVYGDANETITFSMVEPQSPTQTNSLNLILTQQVLSRDCTSSTLDILDNAIVSFNQGNQLEKFYFMEQDANLYIPQDEKEYAIVSVGNVDEIPVNFKAAKNGTYTLTVSGTLNSKLSTLNYKYLHLIDNMTGANIDLLTTPSYIFEARTSDYASRFSLVFTDKNDNVADEGDNTFAFISDGLLQILNQGEAQLQIFDIMGRTLSSETIQGNYSKPFDLNPGVYTLRISNAQTIRTQKIVVR